MKAKKCKLILWTSWGYTLTPIDCPSIAHAKRVAKDYGLNHRIVICQ